MAKRPRPSAPPAHPDLAVVKAETGLWGFLQVGGVHLRHRLFWGEWSGERVYDVLRRGDAVAILLYDPDRDSVVLVEQFRLPPLYAGFSPWQIEPVAGLVDEGESDEAVARREAREEADLEPIGELIAIQRYSPSPGDSDEATMLFCGRIDSRGAGGIHGLPEEHEDIRVVVKTIAQIETMLDTGQIETAHTTIRLDWLL